jgi:pre-mRNA-splicing factor SYF2
LTKEKKEENEEYDIDEIPEENKNRMARELEKKIKKGAKFSRRRTFNEDDDVTFINETNRVFNKKISRAYDQYTNDIKNNLERGTSL